MSVNSLLAGPALMPAVAPQHAGLYRIDSSILPPTLLQRYQASSQKTDSSYSAQGRGLLHFGTRGIRGLWQTAKSVKEVLSYAVYSKWLKARFEKDRAPTEIQRYIYNAKGRAHFPSPGTLAREEGGPVSIVKEANQAYDYSGFTFDFFKEHLGFVLPQPMIQVVNFNDNPLSVGFNNAFFAPLAMGLQMMVYGTADGRYFKSFTNDLTIIAHELGHSYTENVHPGKFQDKGQAGAINEHISDVIAKCVEAKYRGWDDLVGNWKIGADLMVNPDFALRSMSFPGQAYSDPDLGEDRQVGHMKGYVVTEEDAGGVHINSGILNRVFALFCERLKGPVYDIPLKLWVKALKHVKANPSFRDFAVALLEAAQERDLLEPMMEALKETGLMEYELANDMVVPSPLMLEPLEEEKAA